MNHHNSSGMAFGSSSNLFQAATPQQQSTVSLFGNSSFGNTSFGAPTAMSSFGAQPTQQLVAPVGTTIRFVPLAGTDSLPKSASNPGGPTVIQTKHQNITAMKEYEGKSVDELRFEDYTANRKGPQVATSSTTPFGGLQPSVGLNQTQSSPFSFGQPAASTSTTLGGFNNSTSTSLFGSTTNTLQNQQTNQYALGSTFTANPSTSQAGGFSLFSGTQAATTGLFGGPQTSTGLFGSSTINDPNKSMFSTPATTTTSLFGTGTSTVATGGFSLGQTQNNQIKPFGSTGTSLFGQPSTSTTPFGATTSVASAPTFGFGTATNTTQAAQRKGPQVGTGTNVPFGSLQPSVGLNQTQSSPFSFGQPAASTNTTGLGFGASPSTSLFGSTTNTLQNQQTTQSPFGLNSTFASNPSTSQAQGFSLFGSTPATNTSLFGGPAPSTGLFGSSTINDPNKTMFSTPATTTTSLFGTGTSTVTSGGFNLGQTQNNTLKPFGTSGTSLFGQPSTNTTPFGAATSVASTPTFGFGTSTSTTQATSSLTNAPALGFGLSPNTSLQTSSLFGSNPLAPKQTQLGSTGLQLGGFQQPFGGLNQTQPSVNPISSAPVLGSDLLLNRLKTLPYGVTSLEMSDTLGSGSSLNPLKFTTDPKTISSYKMTAKTNVSLDKSVSSEKARASSVLFDGLDDTGKEDLRCAIDVFVPKKNIKKLVLKSNASNISNGDLAISLQLDKEHSNQVVNELNLNDTRQSQNSNTRFDSVNNRNDSSRSSSSRNQITEQPSSINTTINNSIGSHLQEELLLQQRNLKCGVISTRPDYILKPSLDQIERKYNSEKGTCIIDSLLITRPTYGSIFFESQFDVKGVNIDEIVLIRRKEVIVYPDDDKKPPVGQGLNRPATITLHKVWPVDKSTREIIKDPSRLIYMGYPTRIEAVTVEKGARFLEYRPETGSWVFEVKHFSKYGITDEDDDEVVSKLVSLTSMNSSNNLNNQRIIDQQPDDACPQSVFPSAPMNGSKTSLVEQSNDNQTDNFSIKQHSPTKNQSVRFSLQQSILNVGNSKNSKSQSFLNKTTNNESFNSPSNGKVVERELVLREEPDSLMESFSRPNQEISFMQSVLFDDNNDYSFSSDRKESKRSMIVQGAKRVALQDSSSSLNSSIVERSIVTGTTVPQPLRVRDLKIRPDLRSAHNKYIRDISSVCVSGSNKVKFFNGSKRFCWISGNSVVVYDLELIPTKNNALSEDVKKKFETFLHKHSHFKRHFNAPNLIYTDEQITSATSYELLCALHGSIEAGTSPYCEQRLRLEKVIKWLASVNKELPIPSNLYDRILYHMTCDRYDLATGEALKNDHPHLALLLASLNLNKSTLKRQLKNWRKRGIDQYIDPELLKIYALLSGEVDWDTSNKTTIHCLDGMSWTQQLCLFALHSITDIDNEKKKYGLELLPSYVEILQTDTNNVNYHIIARHGPAIILSAAENLLDEWFLLESLKSFSIANMVNSNSNNDATDVVHCNLASQLSALDLRWACFVALHIVNPELRSQVLTRCLEQNINQLREERSDANTVCTTEEWLKQKLNIPAEFIEHAKEVYM